MRKLKAEVKGGKDEEYRKTAAAQMQDCCAQQFQLMESLGLLNRPRDPQRERKVIDEVMKEDKGCMHGINPMHVVGQHPEGRFYEEFKNTFVDGFNNVTYQTTKYRLGEKFMSAFEATEAKFPEEWKDASKIGLVVTHLVAEGTVHLLDVDGKIDAARIYASYAFFIQDLFSVLNKTKAMPNCARVEELYNADEHTLVSFLRKHNPCSCLDKKYKEVKPTAKMSRCYNEKCSQPDGKVERSEVKPCARCRSAFYCSRECQKADWPRHRHICDLNVDFVSRSQHIPSTTSQFPHEPAVNNPITEMEIVELATNETNAGGEDADEHVITPNNGSLDINAAGDVADEGLGAGEYEDVYEGLQDAEDVADGGLGAADLVDEGIADAGDDDADNFHVSYSLCCSYYRFVLILTIPIQYTSLQWSRHKVVFQMAAGILSPRRQEEAEMKEASMKASTTSQHPQSALDNTTSETEIVEQAMNESKSVCEQGKTVLKDFHNKNVL